MERERDRDRVRKRAHDGERVRDPTRDRDHRERDRGRNRDAAAASEDNDGRGSGRGERDPSFGHQRRDQHQHHGLEVRDRDRHRDSHPEERRQEPRTSSGHNRRDHDRDRREQRDSNGRGRDPIREKEWDNFFNPETTAPLDPRRRNLPEVPESEKYGVKVKTEGSSGSGDDSSKPKVEKEKPNFGLSGKLTEETNTFRGVVIKYSEPPEARKPQKIRWRLYPFKGTEALEVMYIHRQSAYLLGRERKIADIPIDHPSCSKQHAAIQYRLMPYERSDGSKGRRIKPYIIDLESGNGTFVNDVKIEPRRYVELFEKDVLKFGFSSREYVLLNEHSKDEPEDDEVVGGTSPLPSVKIKKEPT